MAINCSTAGCPRPAAWPMEVCQECNAMDAFRRSLIPTDGVKELAERGIFDLELYLAKVARMEEEFPSDA